MSITIDRSIDVGLLKGCATKGFAEFAGSLGENADCSLDSHCLLVGLVVQQTVCIKICELIKLMTVKCKIDMTEQLSA